MKKALIVVLLVTTAFCIAGFTPINFTEHNGYPQGKGNGSLNGHEYVDLGLPSGTLWATCNVGAKSPEDYGDYFAWGETRTKASFSNSTYKYSKAKIHGEYTKYSYNTENGYNGYVDKLTTLEPNDDAATVNWGSGWRIPTKDECEELLKHTTKKVETVHKVKGMRLTGPNGQSIFLPAAGNRVDTKLLHNGTEGSYWSSSLNTVVSAAWNFYCNCKSKSCDMFDFNDREIGHTIRPVCSAQKNR